MQGLTLQSRVHFSRALMPSQSGCVVLGGGGVMLQLSPKLAIGTASPRASWKGTCCRLSSAAVCGLPRSTWHKPQSNLQMATTCILLIGALRGQAANHGQLWLVLCYGYSARDTGHAESRCC